MRVFPLRQLVLLAALAALPLQNALAQSPGYVGTWAAKQAHCALDQGVQDAPMILQAKGYDQHEAHCTFTSVSKIDGTTWRAKVRCSVEGDQQRHEFILKVDGDRLTIQEKGGMRYFTRCG